MTTENKGISWGKIIAGAAIAGGAVLALTAGLPTIQESVVPALQSMAETAGGAISSAWNWVGANIIGNVDVAASKAAETATTAYEGAKSMVETAAASTAPQLAGISEKLKDVLPELQANAEVLTKAAAEASKGMAGMVYNNPGTSAAAAAVAGGVLAARSGNHQQPAYAHAPAKNSFAMQEDMRRMQALMQARLAANGQPEAIAAMKHQMGRA